MGTLSIGQVAQRAGVGIETFRFYEREDLPAANVIPNLGKCLGDNTPTSDTKYHRSKALWKTIAAFQDHQSFLNQGSHPA